MRNFYEWISSRKNKMVDCYCTQCALSFRRMFAFHVRFSLLFISFLHEQNNNLNLKKKKSKRRRRRKTSQTQRTTCQRKKKEQIHMWLQFFVCHLAGICSVIISSGEQVFLAATHKQNTNLCIVFVFFISWINYYLFSISFFAWTLFVFFFFLVESCTMEKKNARNGKNSNRIWRRKWSK